MSTAAAKKQARIQLTFKPVEQLHEEDPIVAADNPQPSWLLTATEGRGEEIGTYEVWHPRHLTNTDYEALIVAENERAANPSAEGFLRRQLLVLGYGVPDMPADLHQRLSPNQLLAIEMKIWKTPNETRAEAAERKADAANPPGGAGTSASPSPAPLVDSDGVTTR